MKLPRDGRLWTIAQQEQVEWINEGTGIGRTITAGIPPLYEAYATLVAADRDEAPQQDAALLQLLYESAGDQPWWLGYLDTGADELVFPDAPQVTLYPGWRYVVVQAGPSQAATWRSPSSYRGALPNLMFPVDRRWLVTFLWDDDWRCIGGPRSLVERLVAELGAREVALGEDATPPGFEAR